jgi:hypothetical protein
MGKIAKDAEEQLSIGVEIKVEASYSTGKYTNATGNIIYTHNFMVKNFEVLTACKEIVEENQEDDLNIDLYGSNVDLPF